MPRTRSVFWSVCIAYTNAGICASLCVSLLLSLSSHQVSSIVDEQRRLVDEIMASTKSASRGAPSHVEGEGELERRVLTKKLSMTGTSMFADMMVKG